RHHGIQGGPAGEPQLAGVFNGLLQVFISVKQKIACDMGVSGTQVEGEGKCLGIPVGTAAILLAGESLRADVQPGVLTGVGLVKLEDIEAYSLQCCDVSPDANIAVFPFLSPCITVCLKHCIKSLFCRFSG